MEIDTLKNIWLKNSIEQSTTDVLSSDDVLMTIAKKSNTIISKISKQLRLKIFLQTTMGTIGFLYSLFLIWSDKYTLGTMYLIVFSIILSLGIHKISSYQMIVKFQKSSSTLHSSLRQIAEIMTKVVKTQINTIVSLATAVSCLMAYVLIFKGSNALEIWEVTLIIILLIIAPVLFFLIAKRDQYRMFGKYIKTLEEYLIELDPKK